MTEQNITFDRTTVHYNKKPCYDIVFSKSFGNLAQELAALNIENKKVCIVTDSNVDKLFADEITKIVEPLCKETGKFVIPAGEENKTLDHITDIYRYLIAHKYSRSDMLIALGGGVVGDMTGYAAATYLRGIDFVQIPTTLLAQVDSSIGGKTGVDFEQYKNMVGAFHMPKLVYINIDTLNKLEDRQFSSGFAEVMKHGLIKDAKLYEWLLENMYEIMDRDLDILLEMVYRSCQIKRSVVEKDPTEKGDRALLNFGHTIGHGIEKASNFTLFHGECVALGAVAAANISYMHGLITQDEYLEIRDMFVPFGLPIAVRNVSFTAKDVLANTKSDKKNSSQGLKFILLKKLGNAYIDMSVTDEEIIKAVEELIDEE